MLVKSLKYWKRIFKKQMPGVWASAFYGSTHLKTLSADLIHISCGMAALGIGEFPVPFRLG